MSNDTRRELCYVAGAPWLNLVATVADRNGADPLDRLWDADRLRQWLRHEMAIAADLPIEPADLAHAKRIRETLRILAVAAVEHTAPPDAAVATVNDVLGEYRPPTAYVVDGRLRYTAPESVSMAMARLTRQALTSLTGPDAEQLQSCREPICGAIFLDPSGRRRWCPSGRCGVKARVRAHRKRQAQLDLPGR